MPRVSKNNDYISKGVTISPAVPTAGENVKILYDGILSKSGASDVIAHVGFGSGWESTFDYRMSRSTSGFEASIPVSEYNSVNICFKDCAENWDNNSGNNYVFDVSK